MEVEERDDIGFLVDSGYGTSSRVSDQTEGLSVVPSLGRDGASVAWRRGSRSGLERLSTHTAHDGSLNMTVAENMPDLMQKHIAKGSVLTEPYGSWSFSGVLRIPPRNFAFGIHLTEAGDPD